jgi:eukaryotic-like serine/threonine-protein kinase
MANGERKSEEASGGSSGAVAELEALGFTARVDLVSSTQKPETVVAQDPAPGTLAQPNTTVRLSVSKGPSTAVVPDVKGLSQADATARLRASGFVVGVVTQSVGDPSEDGIVQSQKPAGGSSATGGSAVTIVVGRLGSP